MALYEFYDLLRSQSTMSEMQKHFVNRKNANRNGAPTFPKTLIALKGFKHIQTETTKRSTPREWVYQSVVKRLRGEDTPTISHHATPYHTTAQYATPVHTTPHHTTPCHTTPHHATPHRQGIHNSDALLYGSVSVYSTLIYIYTYIGNGDLHLMCAILAGRFLALYSLLSQFLLIFSSFILMIFLFILMISLFHFDDFPLLF